MQNDDPESQWWVSQSLHPPYETRALEPQSLPKSGECDKIEVMKSSTITPGTEAEVWLRILYPDKKMTADVAHAILGLSFPPADLKRMTELSAKAQAGVLTPDEDFEMDNIERVGSILSILKSKARQALKRTKRRA